jgi:glucose/arabinose dehydrogenase
MPVPIYASPRPDPRRRLGREAVWYVLVACLPLVGLATMVGVWSARGTLGPSPGRQPAVVETRPGDGERGVLPTAFVAADVHLPRAGRGVDSRTLTADNVRLYRAADGSPVPAVVNTSGVGDAIVLTPVRPLDPETRYTFEVTPGVRDSAGNRFRPHRATFTTARGGSVADYPVAFDKVPLPEAPEAVFTGLTFGPDGRLYAGTFDGRIFRFDVRADGTLATPTTISTVPQHNQGPRLITGIRFDPASTAAAPVLWVSHGQMTLEGADEWTGKISRLSGPDLDECRDAVVGLPRAYRDHLNNQLDFGPDGCVYFNQASMTACGAPDKKWNHRPERLLSAAVLRLDPRLLPPTGPVDVRTPDGGGTYDPAAPGAPLTIYATGVRVAFDLLWHSSGRLYAPINGAARGGNAPAGPDGKVPALTDVPTQPDFLLAIDRGGYYGHPNPARAEFVLNGGNPTPQRDPGEVAAYPVGTNPERHWRGFAYEFGRSVSPNGVIEYKSDAFGGRLRGRLLVCRYSGGDDIVVLTPGPRGQITEAISGIEGFKQFVDPLDLVEHPRTGAIYVAEFSGQKLTLLRPRGGDATTRPTSKVFRQEIAWND